MKKRLEKLLESKKGRVPASFWHHFFAASGIDLDGFKNPEILSGNVNKTKEFVENVDPDFVKLMSDGLFNYDFNQEKVNAKTIYEGIEPINDDNPWLIETSKLVRNQKNVIQNKLGFYNVFSPTTLLKWALTKDENGKHNKATADKKIVDAILNDTENVKKALNVITQDVIRQVQSAINAGADGIYYSTQAIQDQRVDQNIFNEFVAHNDGKVLDAANYLSDANILHICGGGGQKNPLDWFKNYNVSIINWSTNIEKVTLGEGKKIFKNKVVLGGLGNTTTDVIYKGSKEKLKEEIDRIINEAGEENVILGANCTVPRDIKDERLKFAVKYA